MPYPPLPGPQRPLTTPDKWFLPNVLMLPPPGPAILEAPLAPCMDWVPCFKNHLRNLRGMRVRKGRRKAFQEFSPAVHVEVGMEDSFRDLPSKAVFHLFIQ